MCKFTNWQALCEEYGLVFPDLVTPISSTQLPELLYFLNEIQATAQDQDKSFDELLSASALIAGEIIHAQTSAVDETERLLLQYLQLEVSIAPIGAAISRGRFDLAFDWIHNGLSDCVDTAAEREFFLERPFRFIAVLVDLLPGYFPNSFLEWSDLFFYYCRHQSALQSPAIEIAKLLEATIFWLPANRDLATKAAISLMCWGRDTQHLDATIIAAQLKSLHNNDVVSRDIKALIAKAFSTRTSDLISEAHYEWAKIVLQDYSDLLVQHEPFQYLFASFETVEDWDANIDRLVEAAQEYSNGVRKTFVSHTDQLIVLDQRANLLSPVANFALDNERASGFAKVLAAWYDGEIETASAGCSVILPTAIYGVGLLGKSTEIIPFRGEFQDSTKVVEAMNESTNQALGITRTVQAGPELAQAPVRPGQPNRNEAAKFAADLIDFYNVPALVEHLGDVPAITSFPHNLHPLQALLLREAGICWPLSSSLRTPLADRLIDKAAIWASCDDYYSEMEARSLSDFLTERNVESQIFLGNECSRDDFLAMYQDPTFDFIHVAGHGSFEHRELGSAKIQISGEEAIVLDELVHSYPGHQGRRLLCLNICDGGVSDGLGGIQKLGLAPSLTSPMQVTVSHLWPVEPRVAAAFGLTLCSELITNSGDHFGAFCASLNRVRNPWQQRVDELRGQFVGDIIERLENFAAPDDIFNWGSPVFFQ